MRHDITDEAFGVRLRPVRFEDASEILVLRNSPHTRGYIGDGAQTVADQEQWLGAYFERKNDYTFIIETAADEVSVGLLGIYNITGDECELGRWVIRPGVMAAPASAWLSLHICFNVVHMKRARMTIVEENKSVISFHRKAGYREVGPSQTFKTIGGKDRRVIEFATTFEDWPKVSKILGGFARVAQKYLIAVS